MRKLQKVIANFETTKRIVLEGKGDAPDEIVKLRRAELISGSDARLQ